MPKMFKYRPGRTFAIKLRTQNLKGNVHLSSEYFSNANTYDKSYFEKDSHVHVSCSWFRLW